MLCMKDHNTLLHITYEDMIKYHGRSFIGGVAMAYKLLELVSAVLTDGTLVRGRFQIVLGVNGPGIVDGIEMATRAKTLGLLSIDQQIARDKDAPSAADGQDGKYYFIVTYAGRTMIVWLRHGLVPQEFLDLADKTHDGTITATETERLQHLKEEIAVFFIAREALSLFHYTLLSDD
ncbi:hypothetical protein [Sporomusa aerivorans]|uniref:hypothetical protein n=1 Tax=Sporomusa aerivorans TaxID=204936 RepID=UPI003529DCFB